MKLSVRKKIENSKNLYTNKHYYKIKDEVNRELFFLYKADNLNKRYHEITRRIFKTIIGLNTYE